MTSDLMYRKFEQLCEQPPSQPLPLNLKATAKNSPSADHMDVDDADREVEFHLQAKADLKVTWDQDLPPLGGAFSRPRRCKSSERCRIKQYDVLDETTQLEMLVRGDLPIEKENTDNRVENLQVQTDPISRKQRRGSTAPRPVFNRSNRGSGEFPKPQLKLARSQSLDGTTSRPFLDALIAPEGSQPGITGRLRHRKQSMNADQFETKIPLIENPSKVDIDSITPETLTKLMTGQFEGAYDQVIIFDCRFKYEYEGGHVRDAIHCEKAEVWQDMIAYKREMHQLGSSNRLAVVFYCEFSSERGPAMWRSLREWDRKANFTEHPRLHFPQTFLLEKGYSNFYNLFPQYCDPNEYIKMEDPRYKVECAAGLKQLRALKKQRSRSEPDVRGMPSPTSELGPRLSSMSLASPNPPTPVFPDRRRLSMSSNDLDGLPRRLTGRALSLPSDDLISPTKSRPPPASIATRGRSVSMNLGSDFSIIATNLFADTDV